MFMNTAPSSGIQTVRRLGGVVHPITPCQGSCAGRPCVMVLEYWGGLTGWSETLQLLYVKYLVCGDVEW
jgi:hypothetical protein